MDSNAAGRPHRSVLLLATDSTMKLAYTLVIEKDIGFGFDDVFYFRVHGHRVRLVVEEYGEVSLWGARRVVTELSNRVAERLTAKGQ